MLNSAHSEGSYSAILLMQFMRFCLQLFSVRNLQSYRLQTYFKKIRLKTMSYKSSSSQSAVCRMGVADCGKSIQIKGLSPACSPRLPLI